jgi:Putative restriction endonuclease
MNLCVAAQPPHTNSFHQLPIPKKELRYGIMTPQQLLTNKEQENADAEERQEDFLQDGVVIDGIVTELDISHLVIEDDTPVDNFQSAQQQRLLVEPLYSSQALPQPFLAEANVGLFYKIKGDPIVPDVLLSLGVQRAADYAERQNRSYFIWEFGKVPEVCIEIVSNNEGDELMLSKKSQKKGKTTTKKEVYAQIGVRYYVVFDPLRQIQGETEMNGSVLRVWSVFPEGYTEITPAEGINEIGQLVWLPMIGLSLNLWEGQFEEEVTRLWLRWCDRSGQVIPTGAEGKETERQRAETERQRAEAESQRAEAESQRAETERQRAEAESQRAEAESQRAETERQRAEAESQRAETERQRAERLAERLRELNIDPDEI